MQNTWAYEEPRSSGKRLHEYFMWKNLRAILRITLKILFPCRMDTWDFEILSVVIKGPMYENPQRVSSVVRVDVSGPYLQGEQIILTQRIDVVQMLDQFIYQWFNRNWMHYYTIQFFYGFRLPLFFFYFFSDPPLLRDCSLCWGPMERYCRRLHLTWPC